MSSETREERLNRPDFNAVYTAHASFIWRVLRGMGVSDALVQDAVQDVFIVVHNRYHEFDHRFKVRTWLFEIAYRVARDYRRKSARYAALELMDDDPQYPMRGSSPAQQAEQSQEVELLARVLDMLDDEKRAVLVLADIEELTAPEIAELINVPLNTVYTRLRRARIQFREALAMQKGRQK